MKTLILLAAIVALTACAKVEIDDTIPQGAIGIDFQPFVDSFVNEGSRYGVAVDTRALTVSFDSTLGEGSLGYCDKGSVIINEKFWRTSVISDRESLLFHELGHCLLGRSHSSMLTAGYEISTNTYRVDVPASLMNPNHLAGYFYVSNRDDLLKELFTGTIPTKLYF